MIPPKPTALHTILAESTTRVRTTKSGRKLPFLKWFTAAAWKHMSKITEGSRQLNKVGFIRVDPGKYRTPEEAAPKGESDQKTTEANEGATQTEDNNIVAAIKAGEAKDAYTVKELHVLVEDLGLEIEGYKNLTKAKLLDEMQALLNED